MDKVGNFEIKPFKRIINAEFVEMSSNTFFMTGLAEIDVTKARQIISRHKEKTGERISFTAWIIHCVGHAVGKHKEVHAIRKRKKLYIFDDVDIFVPVEKIIDGRVFPIILVIRKANEKTVLDIHNEIRAAQTVEDGEMTTAIARKKLKFLLKLPKFIRYQLLWGRAKRNPLFMKKNNGTVLVTAIGMFGQGKKGWGINLGFSPVSLVIGGISEQPRLIDGKLVNREFLNLTIKVNHITVDGAPAVRFGNDLLNFIEEAHGLENV